MTTIWLHLATVNEEFIAFNKAIDEEVIRARAQLKLDMIQLRKELDEQEKREIAAAKQRYLDELAAKKEKGNYMLIIGWSGIGGQISYYIDKLWPSAQIFYKRRNSHKLGWEIKNFFSDTVGLLKG